MNKIWPVILDALRQYKSEKKNMTKLAERCGFSRDTLYKYLNPNNSICPSFDHIVSLAKCLDLRDDLVYRDFMKNPERADGVLQAEDEAPELLDGLLDLIRQKGANSPEARKLLEEIRFLTRE